MRYQTHKRKLKSLVESFLCSPNEKECEEKEAFVLTSFLISSCCKEKVSKEEQTRRNPYSSIVREFRSDLPGRLFGWVKEYA